MIKNVEIKGPAIKITMMAAALLMVLLLNPLSLDAQEYRFFQGVVDKKGANHLEVNEMHVNITVEAVTKNKDDQVIPLDLIEEGKCVYIEGPLNMDGSMDAVNIYLLPGKILKKERRNYPFMKLPAF